MRDLELDEFGEIVNFEMGGQWAVDIKDTVQELKIRLHTHLGEYFLDSRMGIDWMVFMEEKASPSNMASLELQLSREVLSIPHISRITERVTAEFNNESRTITIRFGFTTTFSQEEVSVKVDAIHSGVIKLLVIDSAGAIL